MVKSKYGLRIDEDSWKERCSKKPTQTEIFKDLGISFFSLKDSKGLKNNGI